MPRPAGCPSIFKLAMIDARQDCRVLAGEFGLHVRCLPLFVRRLTVRFCRLIRESEQTALVIGPLTLENLKSGAVAPFARETTMGDPEIGWIAAIIIGGIAGWLAEQFMKSDMGLLMNIVLGIVGAAIGSAIFSFFGIALGGWLGYLIAGFVGASLLIWIVRALRGRTA
jgi:uncharacterized membrane protein YeaQ/YmgE (transglycosylase-associated protein family)